MKKYIECAALFKAVEDYASCHPVIHDDELFALFCSIPAADVRPKLRAETGGREMYDKLIKDLRENHDKYFARDMQAADAIEKLSRAVDDLCETIDMYRKALGGHPDPRGPEGPSGITEAEP